MRATITRALRSRLRRSAALRRWTVVDDSAEILIALLNPVRPHGGEDR